MPISILSDAASKEDYVCPKLPIQLDGVSQLTIYEELTAVQYSDPEDENQFKDMVSPTVITDWLWNNQTSKEELKIELENGLSAQSTPSGMLQHLSGDFQTRRRWMIGLMKTTLDLSPNDALTTATEIIEQVREGLRGTIERIEGDLDLQIERAQDAFATLQSQNAVVRQIQIDTPIHDEEGRLIGTASSEKPISLIVFEKKESSTMTYFTAEIPGYEELFEHGETEGEAVDNLLIHLVEVCNHSKERVLPDDEKTWTPGQQYSAFLRRNVIPVDLEEATQ